MTTTTADKMNHDIKKFRAERNSYLSFGTLFLALIISQFWSLLNRILSLEESESKKTMVHEALVKQVKNREAQSGLVEVAKGLKEYESTGNVTEDKESLIKTITALQAEIKQLRANAAGSETELKDKDADPVKKRPTAAAVAAATKADKDD
eukprot:CAMPEP_0113726856 /NCGR_PEP_ID=MMETSP0038_2-20120614/40719_1 /TAXON_ID=2898 /ORGANISM="Cryptomonas paramecium" /LENGTH=150 /DNA_ID=CAMNT_0000657619 /DNA_START=221 /DNA_END=672 /DNA_ORIENTATION=- /assembly_acc=CAM_ASM_000170